jgi:nucleotide-binding universal stress UspA family protein
MAILTDQIEKSPTAPVRAIPAFKRILVHVDRDKRSDQRVEMAVALATRFGGKMTGVYVSRPVLPPAIAMGALPPAFFADQEKLLQEEVDDAMRRYLDHVIRKGLEGDWHCVREASVPALRRLARYADLAIVGQTDPDVPEELIAVRPEELALGSGRPVLVMPYIGATVGIGKRVAIAWDGSREAARAVVDALPILVGAESVWAVSIDARTGGTTDPSQPAEDLCHFLGDHGISAKPDNLQTDGVSKADVLLSRLSDLGADLLVMGCYGHSRVRELVLGGMTRGILQHMTVPVLLSH